MTLRMSYNLKMAVQISEQMWVQHSEQDENHRNSLLQAQREELKKNNIFVVKELRCFKRLSQASLIGQNVFDYLHPKDIAKVKEQLSSSDVSPREKRIDVKNHRKYSTIHCTGYLKSWPLNEVGVEEENEAEKDSVLQSKEKIFTNSYKFRATERTFILLRSQWFSFINPWTKELEYIVSTNSVVLLHTSPAINELSPSHLMRKSSLALTVNCSNVPNKELIQLCPSEMEVLDASEQNWGTNSFPNNEPLLSDN